MRPTLEALNVIRIASEIKKTLTLVNACKIIYIPKNTIRIKNKADDSRFTIKITVRIKNKDDDSRFTIRITVRIENKADESRFTVRKKNKKF